MVMIMMVRIMIFLPESNEFIAKTSGQVHCTTPRISSDNGFATLHLCLDDDIGGIGDIGGEERSISGQVRREEA